MPLKKALSFLNVAVWHAAKHLMSYGAAGPEVYRRSAAFVTKILQGGNPANIPVEQPTKFELVINVKTAKALGITVPQSLLTRADIIVE